MRQKRQGQVHCLHYIDLKYWLGLLLALLFHSNMKSLFVVTQHGRWFRETTVQISQTVYIHSDCKAQYLAQSYILTFSHQMQGSPKFSVMTAFDWNPVWAGACNGSELVILAPTFLSFAQTSLSSPLFCSCEHWYKILHTSPECLFCCCCSWLGTTQKLLHTVMPLIGPICNIVISKGFSVNQ